jgi:glutaredoxin-like protein NrdH
MDMKHVNGKDKGHILMYALSTCGWCKKTKRLLEKLGVEYDYTDVDLLEGEDKAKAIKELERWNPRRSFPTLVINDECIVGYKEDEIKEAIGA